MATIENKTLKIEFSPKQKEFIDACNTNPNLDHRYYGKTGATRSGKTTLDFMWVIPFRARCRKGMQGLCCITGVSLGTISRNVLEPMRNYWSKLGYKKVISETKKGSDGNNFVLIFGEKFYLIGMEKINAVAKLRGAEFKYAYCDELAECNEEAFQMLKSRLSLPYSTCDFTCNPASQTHWLYKFIKSDIDLYLQEYTLFDNPFLAKSVVENLVREFSSSEVYTQRFIYGKWVAAEGLIYKSFADNRSKYILYETPKIMKITIGCDWGGNGSATTFVATGFGFNYGFIVHLESVRIEGIQSPSYLEERFIEFVNMLKEKYKDVLIRTNRGFDCYCDSAEQTLIQGFRICVAKNKLPVQIHNAKKRPIKDRIMLQTKLFSQNRLFFMFQAQSCIEAYATALWNSKTGHEDERLDDGTSDIDTMDASEYSFEADKDYLLRTQGGLING